MSDLEQDEKPTAWKSMESAPKDGREILVRNNFGHWVVVWSRSRSVWDDGSNPSHSANSFDSWTDIPS